MAKELLMPVVSPAELWQRRNLVDIRSDSGMMGGAVAHEYMLVSDVGEDTLVLCNSCRYRANREVAAVRRDYGPPCEREPLREVETPGTTTIEDLADALQVPISRCAKAVAFVASADRGTWPVIAFVRGDCTVNPIKVRNLLGARDLRPMHPDEFAACGTVPGYVGPIGLSRCGLVFDTSVVESNNLIIGGNVEGLHKTGFDYRRDAADDSHVVGDISEVVEGDPCPSCGSPLHTTRGVELGNIFQLGTKYSASMGLQ